MAVEWYEFITIETTQFSLGCYPQNALLVLGDIGYVTIVKPLFRTQVLDGYSLGLYGCCQDTEKYRANDLYAFHGFNFTRQI